MILSLPVTSLPRAAALRQGAAGNNLEPFPPRVPSSRRRRHRRRRASPGCAAATVSLGLASADGGGARHGCLPAVPWKVAAGPRRTAIEAGGGGGGGAGGPNLGPYGLRWVSPDLSSRHLPGSDYVPESSWAPPAIQGRLGLLSRTWWWWWPYPQSEVVDRSSVASLPDFAIRHLVPTGVEWLPVKTESDFGLGG
jgi:hypothetical protein